MLPFSCATAASPLDDGSTGAAPDPGGVTVKAFDQALHNVPSLARTHSVSTPVPPWYVSCASCAAETKLSWFAPSVTPLSTKCPPPLPAFQTSYCVIASPSGSLTVNR